MCHYIVRNQCGGSPWFYGGDNVENNKVIVNLVDNTMLEVKFFLRCEHHVLVHVGRKIKNFKNKASKHIPCTTILADGAT